MNTQELDVPKTLYLRAFLEWAHWSITEYLELPTETVAEWMAAWEAEMQHASLVNKKTAT